MAPKRKKRRSLGSADPKAAAMLYLKSARKYLNEMDCHTANRALTGAYKAMVRVPGDAYELTRRYEILKTRYDGACR